MKETANDIVMTEQIRESIELVIEKLEKAQEEFIKAVENMKSSNQ